MSLKTNPRVVVIGAGTMGRGIAQWFASRNCPTLIVDHKLELAKNGIKEIHKKWDRLVEKKILATSQVKKYKGLMKATTLVKIPKEVDLVIEAIFEDRQLKRDLFSKLDKKLSPKTIFASNTSSFLIASLCSHLSQQRKKTFIGIHFFNPAPLMKLVEIITSPWSDHNLCIELKKFFQENEKVPVICQDSPGFIVNRVARNFYGEALRISGNYDLQKIIEIDRVLTEVGGFKMGPFRLMDLIGIDINYAVTQSVWEAYFYLSRFAPHPLQKQMVESLRLGMKTNEGFYTYEN